MDLTRLLSPKEAESPTGHSEKTLANWRSLGRGPKFIKASGRVKYDPRDIEEWKNAHRFNSTSEVA